MVPRLYTFDFGHSVNHRWSAPIRTTHTTDRQCSRCGMIRRTRHDNPAGWPWVEWHTGDGVVTQTRTPTCDGGETRAVIVATGRLPMRPITKT